MIELPFRDRCDAGQQLGSYLAQHHFDLGKKAIVLGLARGGVSVAAEVAALLHLPLDVVVVRRLGFPGQKELAMGAVAGGRIQVLDNGLIEEHQIQSREVAEDCRQSDERVNWREHDYRAERATPDLHDSTVILVDDGLATGFSMLAAVHYVNSFKPKKVIAAVRVGTDELLTSVKLSDHCVCLATPKGFHAVGQCYLEFTQVTDDEVRQILEEERSAQRAGAARPFDGRTPIAYSHSVDLLFFALLLTSSGSPLPKRLRLLRFPTRCSSTAMLNTPPLAARKPWTSFVRAKLLAKLV